MAGKLISRSLHLAPSAVAPRIASRTTGIASSFHTSNTKLSAVNLTPNTISAITAREKLITDVEGPVEDGPTAQAQKHAGQPLTSAIVSEIMQGEQLLTGLKGPIAGGPAAYVQKLLDLVWTPTISL